MGLLFIEYLIEKKFATHEQILDATIEQLKSIPSIAEVIYANEFLTNQELLKVLCHQQSSGADFFRSAETIGVWSKEIKEKVNKKIDAVRKPIGEILIEKKIINLEILSSAFVSYVEETKQETQKINEDTNAYQFNSVLLNEFITSLEENLLPNIENSISLLEELTSLTSTETPEYLHTKFQELVKKSLSEFVAIRAELRFLGARQTEGLIDAAIKFLDIFSITNLPIEIPCVIQILKSSTQILKSITPYLKDFKNENTLGR